MQLRTAIEHLAASLKGMEAHHYFHVEGWGGIICGFVVGVVIGCWIKGLKK
jgi:hypothetical protein